MALNREYADFVEDILQPFGDVSIKSMFGGGGVYHDGTMFALIADDVLYLKFDSTTEAEFEAEGTEPFLYTAKNGKVSRMSYWQIPERLYDDPDELAEWAQKAYAIAKKGKKSKK